MLVRRLEAAEKTAAVKIFSVAFEAGTDVNGPNPDFRPEQFLGAFIDGTLCSQVQCIPFEMRFDGAWLPMGGVACVSTLPGYRRRGAVRAIFAELLPQMREAGQIFSVLYPFSYPFYRKYGYESTYRRSQVTIPLSSLAHLPQPSAARFQEPEDSTEPFLTLYERFAHGRNLALRRPETHFREHVLPRDPWKDRKHAHLLSDAAGAPSAYLVTTPAESDSGRVLKVRDWAIAEMGALAPLLGFIGSYRSHYDRVEIEVPSDILPTLLLEDHKDVECSTTWASMARLVDVEAVLAKARWPEGRGRVTLSVQDDLLDWNCGTFTVDFEGSQGAVTRGGGLAPDLTVDVRTLARLLLGSVDLGEPTAALLPGLAVAAGSERTVRECFPRKPMLLADFF